MDPIQPFIDECCNVMPLARERTSSLYRCYQGFCGRLGERPVGLPRFGESLAHKGFPTTSSGGRMIRLGICLRPSTESLVG